MCGNMILTRDVPERGLRAGDVGTVVERHVVSGVAEEGDSVEFFDMISSTVAVVTRPASTLRLPTPVDRMAAWVERLICGGSGRPAKPLDQPQPLVELVPTRENAAHHSSLS
jgi:Domain of unknown function (DUF4926)